MSRLSNRCEDYWLSSRRGWIASGRRRVAGRGASGHLAGRRAAKLRTIYSVLALVASVATTASAQPIATPVAAGPSVVSEPLFCGGGARHVPSTTDYVVVIDDSGSMKRTDPDRLAVLAAKVFAQLVGDNEQVAIFGMNALAGAKAPASWARLTAEAVEKGGPSAGRRFGAASELADYPGQITPCRNMLTALRGVLNELAKRGARRQVVLLLTDGQCEGQGQAPEPAQHWLRGVQARQHLRVYLVPFKQRGKGIDDVVTAGLWDYVRQTLPAGDRMEKERFAVSSGDAARIVEVFANILADSRGYALPTLEQVTEGRTFESASRISVLRLERMAGALSQPGWELWQRAGGTRYGVWLRNLPPPLVSAQVDERSLIVPDYGVLSPRIHVSGDHCSKAGFDEDALSTVEPGAPYCVSVSLVSGDKPLSRAKDLRHEIRFEGGRPLSKDTASAHWRWDALAPQQETELCLRATISVGDRQLQAEHALTVSGQALRFVPKDAMINPARRRAEPNVWGRIDAGSVVTWTLKLEGKGLSGHHPFEYQLKGAAPECAVLTNIDQKKLGLGQSFAVTIEVPSSCRTDARQQGRVEFKLADIDAKAEFSFTPVPVPAWRYWGPIVMKVFAVVFVLVTLWCLLRGWLVPSRRLPARRRSLALFYTRSRDLLTAPADDFKRIDEQKGVIPLATQFAERGWYRNLRVRLGPQGNLVRSRSPQLLLELLPDRNGTLLLVRVHTIELYRVSMSLLFGREPEEFLSEVRWQHRPTLHREVGWPCRWYARLRGRMAAVDHTKVADGEWFQFGKPSDGELYFKIDRSPYTAEGGAGQ